MSSVALSDSLIGTGLILCFAVHKAVEVSQGYDFVEIVVYDAGQYLCLKKNKEGETRVGLSLFACTLSGNRSRMSTAQRWERSSLPLVQSHRSPLATLCL